MKKLTEEQRLQVRNFLAGQGLTFGPLLDEMLDHVSSDLEERVEQGLSFNDAWHELRDSIPQNHFLSIQTETMETIKKRFSISRILSMAALVLMFGGIIFKILHLRGASEVLILSFAAIAGSFLSATVSGIYFNKEKQGALRLVSILAGTLLLMTGFTFRLMHWPGANFLVTLGVGVSLVSLLFNTLYAYRNRSTHVNLLSYLHEKHTPGIERFLLILLVPVAILRILTLPLPQNAFLGSVILVIIIYAAGVQFFVISWRVLERESALRKILNLSALVLSAICFSLVFLGEVLGFEIRLVLIAVFSIVTAWLTYQINPPKNHLVSGVLVLVAIVFTVNALIRLNLVPVSNTNLIFNVVVLVLLATGLFISPKYEATRAFMIVSLAGYLLEFTGTLI
jgi:hypothetical protein